MVPDSALKEKVRKIGAEQVRMNSWLLLPAAGAPLPKEGATSGSCVSHEQRPLGGPLAPHPAPLTVFVLDSFNAESLHLTSLPARRLLKFSLICYLSPCFLFCSR